LEIFFLPGGELVEKGASWQWGELSWYHSEWATNQNGKCIPDEICIHPVFVVILYYCFANNLARIRKDGSQALDVQWIKCRVNVEKKIVSLINSDTIFFSTLTLHFIHWTSSALTVTLFFFPHWPYILFIERRVPVDGYADGTRIEWELARILSKQDFDPDHCTGTWPMVLNFPVFATVVRIFRASNDVGHLFLGPGSTRILEINTR
jgi:hypothetical protein